MWPKFKSWHWHHMWVEFVVGSLLYSERFFRGTPVFPSPQKPIFPNSNSTRNQVDEEPLCGCATSKSLFIYFLYLFYLSPSSFVLLSSRDSATMVTDVTLLLSINYQLIRWTEKHREASGANSSRLLKSYLVRMDWLCPFLYNLWSNIPGRWSLKIKCKCLWKVLKKTLKVVAIFCMNPEETSFAFRVWLMI